MPQRFGLDAILAQLPSDRRDRLRSLAAEAITRERLVTPTPEEVICDAASLLPYALGPMHAPIGAWQSSIERMARDIRSFEQLANLARASRDGSRAIMGPPPKLSYAEVRLVRAALSSFGQTERELLRLRYVNRCSLEECARLRRLSVPAARRRLEDARRALIRALSSEPGDRGDRSGT